ncbi:MAG: PilZ domain-containing protein [Pseudomonadota bacterium]|nr:PilZ domain-containing protein [Pseudomonadota bacterium]
MQEGVDGAGGRPKVLPAAYADEKTLYEAYMPFLKGGGLFIVTGEDYLVNDEVILLVKLPDAPKGVPVPGRVVWKTPSESVGGRQAGIGVEFRGREGSSLRYRIEGVLGARLHSDKPTLTM